MYWLSYFTKAILVLSHYVHANKQMTIMTDKVQVNILKIKF